MRFRVIFSIMKKQIKDTFKNPIVLILFVFFPIMSLILTETVAKTTEKLPDTYFAVLFATIFVGIVPTINMANIIAEEKEKDTLRVLIMANVKPMEYFLGIAIELFLLCSIGISLFAVVGSFYGGELIRFIIFLMIGVIGSLFLGAAIGIISSNQMSASGIAIPLGVISAFLPMIAGFSSSFEKVSNFLYTQQINYLISNLSMSSYDVYRFIIIIVNILIFIAVFILAYKKKGIKLN